MVFDDSFFFVLYQTHVFDWYVIHYDQANKHRKATCVKEIGLCLQITSVHSTMNTIGRTYVSRLEKSANTHFSQPEPNQRTPEFHPIFADVSLQARLSQCICKG